MVNSTTVWGPHDDAKYNRLAAEMNEDMKLQFKLFSFSITATTAVLGFLTSKTGGETALAFPNLPLGAFFLAPLVLLLPTSLMVFNRARTRNRKAAYVIIALDYKRLKAEGVTDKTPLKEVRKLPVIPWETALHILDRTNIKAQRRIHIAPSLKYMNYSYFVIEILCVILAFYTSKDSARANPHAVVTMGTVVAVVLFLIYKYRYKVIKELLGSISVQGYVESWLKYKYQDNAKDAPLYLREWLEEYKSNESKPIHA